MVWRISDAAQAARAWHQLAPGIRVRRIPGLPKTSYCKLTVALRFATAPNNVAAIPSKFCNILSQTVRAARPTPDIAGAPLTARFRSKVSSP